MTTQIFQGQPPLVDGRSEREVAVYKFLNQLGIAYTTACHTSTHTMEACLAVERILDVPVCKNLFLCNRQQTQFYLLMLPGDKVFKTRFLSAQLGCARLSFASDESMFQLLGIHPGAVSPLGLMNDRSKMVRLIIDRDLLSDSSFGCHPCVNTATLKIKLDDFLHVFLPAVEHDYTIVDLPNGVDA